MKEEEARRADTGLETLEWSAADLEHRAVYILTAGGAEGVDKAASPSSIHTYLFKGSVPISPAQGLSTTQKTKRQASHVWEKDRVGKENEPSEYHLLKDQLEISKPQMMGNTFLSGQSS